MSELIQRRSFLKGISGAAVAPYLAACGPALAESREIHDRFNIRFGIVGTDTPVKDLADEDWNRVLDINLKGSFLVAKHVLKQMVGGQLGVGL